MGWTLSVAPIVVCRGRMDRGRPSKHSPVAIVRNGAALCVSEMDRASVTGSESWRHHCPMAGLGWRKSGGEAGIVELHGDVRGFGFGGTVPARVDLDRGRVHPEVAGPAGRVRVDVVVYDRDGHDLEGLDRGGEAAIGLGQGSQGVGRAVTTPTKQSKSECYLLMTRLDNTG